MEFRLNTSLAVDSKIISFSSSPFALSVAPVETKSTMQSDNPQSGANSILP